MLSILSKLFGKTGGDIAVKLGGVLDKFITTKSEKAQAEKEITEVFLNHEVALESEITKRHSADMMSDSWLSKNIRPLITLFSLFIYTVFAITDGNIGSFDIDNQYVDLMAQIMKYALGFYFTSRGLEKVANIISKK